MSDRHPPTPTHDPASDSGTWPLGVGGVPAAPCPSERLLAARVDGELDGRRSGAVDAHLDGCPACAAAVRRLEGLSGLLRSWEAKRALVPPPRIAERILREVESDRALARRDAAYAARRLVAAAAVVVLALGGAVAAALADASADRAAVETAFADRLAAERRAASERLGQELGQEDGARVGAERPAFPDAATSSTAFADALGTLENGDSVFEGIDGVTRTVATLPADVSAAAIRPVPDEGEPGAFGLALVVRALDARRSYGEVPAVFGNWLVVPGALEDLRRAHREDRHLAERARRLAERATLTVDPTAAGVALHGLLAPPDRAALAAYLSAPAKAEEAATRSRGGIVVRALPDMAAAVPSTSHARVLDLADAVRSGRVRLAEDPRARADTVTAFVLPGDVPVLVPAGELLEGGIVDRVVARGTWLPASADTYPVRLPCRAVGRGTRRPTEPIAPIGAIAGPGLRGLLAIGGDGEAVLALVEAQLRDASLDGGLDAERATAKDRGARALSLLALYRAAGTSPTSSPNVRAERLLAALPPDATGFVATDPWGRLQGIERVNLPAASGPATLRRLLAGYLAESGTRSSVDGVRIGAHVESVLATLSDRPVRLLPPAGSSLSGGSSATRVVLGEEPATGVAFESVAGDADDAFALTSGLVPEIR